MNRRPGRPACESGRPFPRHRSPTAAARRKRRVFQQPVGLVHGRHAAARDPAHLPNRRRLGTGRKRTAIDPLANKVHDPFGSLHVTLPPDRATCSWLARAYRPARRRRSGEVTGGGRTEIIAWRSKHARGKCAGRFRVGVNTTPGQCDFCERNERAGVLAGVYFVWRSAMAMLWRHSTVLMKTTGFCAF